MSEPSQSGRSSGDWGPCPPGELRNLASRLRSRRGMPVVLQLALVVVIGVGVGFGAYALWSPEDLTCAQCSQFIAAWRQGKVPSRDVQARIKQHLAHCHGCRDRHGKALERLLAYAPLFVPGWNAVVLAEMWSGHSVPRAPVTE